MEESAFPLFKGCTRVPTVAGVPMMPLMFMVIGVAVLAMMVSLWCWLLLAPAWAVMAAVTKHDDKAFRILGLWVDTKLRNRNKSFWGASTYSRTKYRKRK